MSETPIIEVKNLHKYFASGKQSILRSGQQIVRAVDGVNLEIKRGEILALAGESGCGKSTLALTLLGLEQATEGQILIHGNDIASANARQRKALKREIQMIFQDPYESLNPVMTIGDIVTEPLNVHRIGSNREERYQRAITALEQAGLKSANDYINRFPHELSGGQRQRAVIASALILQPSVLLADEPVSMLDVSIRAEILNLLSDLRRDHGISMLYITHDLSTVSYIADRVAIMYLGRIVEIGSAQDVLNHPQHPYTIALRSVVPVPNPRLRTQHMVLEGETPNPVNLPPYCRFAARCPLVTDACRQVDPTLQLISDNHQVACILANS